MACGPCGLFVALLVVLFCKHAETFAVVGYVPDYRYSDIDWMAVGKQATHLIFFSIEATPEATITATDRLPSHKVWEEAQRARQVHGTRLLACLGGAGRSDGLLKVLSSDKLARQRFVRTLVKVIDKFELDGVDFDVEAKLHLSDWQALGNILKGVSEAFQRRTRRRGRRMWLTMPYHPLSTEAHLWSLKSPSGRSITDYVDLFHAMAYDHSGPYGGPGGGRHSTLALAERAVAHWKQTMPPGSLAKVTLGIPLFGRKMNAPGEVATFRELLKQHPKLSSKQDETPSGYFFNNAATVQLKVQLAQREGLGGVMFWELGQDLSPANPRSLLRAARRAVNASATGAEATPNATTRNRKRKSEL